MTPAPAAPASAPRPARTLLDSAAACFLAAALPTLALYLATVAPSLPTGDSGELITAAATLGVAHPPGYPLYIWLGRLWIALLPWGSVALRLNVLSGVCGAVAAGLVAVAVRRLTRSGGAGIAAAWLLAVSAPQWKNSVVAEVFAPNAALAAAALLAFVTLLAHLPAPPRTGARRSALPPPSRVLAPAAWITLGLLATLLVSLHHTLVLLMLPILSVCLALPALRPRGVERIGAALAAVAGLLPLAQLPLAARSQSALVWGEGDTLRGILRQVLRADYGTFQLAPQGAGATGGDSHGLLYLMSMPAALGWLGVMLVLVGAVVVFRRHHALGWALGGFALLQAVFFTRAGLPADIPVTRSVIERFYLLPNVCAALLAGVGAAELFARLKAKRLVVALGAALIIAQPLLTTARSLGPRPNHFAEHLGRGILNSIPQGGVLFVRGDLEHNALEYLTRVAHERPDVAVIDQELLTYDWYVRQVRRHHPDVLPPLGGAQRITLRDGRVLDGWVAPRAGGKVAVLAEHQSALADTSELASVEPIADPSRVFAETRKGFRDTWLSPRAEDRYSGLPGTRNLLWLDHLVPRRAVSFFGLREESWSLGYELAPEGLVMTAYPIGGSPALGAQLARELQLAHTIELDDYFRPWPAASFEAAERGALPRYITRTALLLCQPGSGAIAAGEPKGTARIHAFAERFERLDPSPDPSCLRAIGFLRVYGEGFKDSGRAKSDLDRYLAAAPTGSEADEVRALRERLGN